MSFKEVSSLRKAGRTAEAFEMARDDFARSPDKWSASALFWVYYSISKSGDFSLVPAWRAGSEMLRLADYMERDEIMLQCLGAAVQHIATLYAHQYMASNAVPSVEETDFLERAAKRFPDNVFLLRALAMGYMVAGRNDDALSLFRKVLKIKNDGYLWSELYDFLDDDSVRKSALCKSLLIQSKPEFTGKTRLKLACVLIRENDYGRAAYELRTYSDTYRKNSWCLSAEYSKIMRFIPPGTVPLRTGREFYAENTAAAEEFVYQDSPCSEMIPLMTREVRAKGGKRIVTKIVLADKKGRVLAVPLSRAGVPPAGCMNVAYAVRSYKPGDGPRRVISCAVADGFPEWRDDVRCFAGPVRLKTDRLGNQYGLVDGCFIPAQLVSRIKPDADVTVVGVRKNGKWRATSIL